MSDSVIRRQNAEVSALDNHIGERLRAARLLRGVTQQTLGESQELSFQQIQKYERGANRIGGGRLVMLARYLDLPISFFFEGIDDDSTEAAKKGGGDAAEAVKPMNLGAWRAFNAVNTFPPKVKSSLVALIKAVAESPDQPQQED